MYTVQGGKKLQGKIRVGGNKNAALPCLAATLLSSEEVILGNIPAIADVKVIFKIFEYLGVTVRELSRGRYAINASGLSKHDIPQEYSRLIRASILFMGPLLARTGEVSMHPPGGDVIGRRRLDTHFHALRKLGAQFEIQDSFYGSVLGKLQGKEIFMDEASVTGTENTIMAAVLAQGTTVLYNAASEPHVRDLCLMLNQMGAKISGIGSNVLTIQGVEKLFGTEFNISFDFIEAGSFIGLAAVCGAGIEIQDVNPFDLRMVEIYFERLGVSWEYSGNSLFVPEHPSLKMEHDMGGAIAKIDDSPWPGFPADLMSIMVVVATQAQGVVLIHEKMYESRLFFVDKLIQMGAQIILCDPHRAIVSGKSALRGAHMSSPDVRAGMALLIAALCAQGKSQIQNVYQIERGYENILGRLRGLGASIEEKTLLT